MSEILRKLKGLLDPILESRGAFLVDSAIRSERGGKLVQVYVDTDAGIRIEECAAISRVLAQELDREGIIEGSYRLEVSSPGIEEPLHLLRQYRKNVGRRFKVTHQSSGSPATIIGKLEAIEGETLKFEIESGESVMLDFSKIIESREQLPW